ncbi:ATP-binding protein [Laceyella putida]|uniref:histidine kinase n=1 Tax=Laceyella putida TaxID=110101 RepID=A0ABW2RGT4_9BACL
MLDVQAVESKGWLYQFIEQLFSVHPSLHWISVGLITTLLSFLLILNQKRVSQFPRYGYMATIVGTIALLDIFTQTIPILTVYLIVLGYVLFRATDEKTNIITASFFISYILISSFTEWSYLRVIELVSHCLLFIWIAWISDQVRDRFFELKKQKEKTRHIIYQKNVSNQRLREFQRELEETYLRDSLTGLYNFHGFQEQVTRGLSRCVNPLSYHVVCFDLTNFRQINMKEGNDTGDRLLVQIANQLKRHLPPSARIARYDGDQFAIGLMGDGAVLRRLIETVEFVLAELKASHSLLNYCLASASYPAEAKTGAQLIRQAEDRLMIAQRQLRDKEEEHRLRLEKLSALGQLAAGLAHEIRNPLTSIRGFVQISATESEAVKKWESIILPEIDRINDLLKQFLNLSEAKPVKVTRFNLNRLMNDVLSLLQPKSLLMGHELIGHPPDQPVVMEADAEQLKQVLINLVQNGLEAMQEKGTVEVSWQMCEDQVQIRVLDTGNGIPPELYNRIFEPFFTTKDEGTGMGLAICHRIIEDHGGIMCVTSNLGLGTSFNIQLPLKQTTLGEVVVSEEYPPETAPEPSPRLEASKPEEKGIAAEAREETASAGQDARECPAMVEGSQSDKNEAPSPSLEEVASAEPPDQAAVLGEDQTNEPETEDEQAKKQRRQKAMEPPAGEAGRKRKPRKKKEAKVEPIREKQQEIKRKKGKTVRTETAVAPETPIMSQTNEAAGFAGR